MLSVEDYLNKMKPYIKGIINNLEKSGASKIQLTIAIKFFSSEDDSDEARVMHSRSDNIEIMISDKADEVVIKLFDSLKNRHQNNLEII